MEKAPQAGHDNTKRKEGKKGSFRYGENQENSLTFSNATLLKSIIPIREILMTELICSDRLAD